MVLPTFDFSAEELFHEKIRIAQVREYDYGEVFKDIDDLVDVSKYFDDMATVRKMKEIVPEYKSNNSVYEVLDQKEVMMMDKRCFDLKQI